jgi:ribose-phosphate pyrophosphokinase
MSYTLIDSDAYATVGIETMFFPGGEPHVKLPRFKGDVLFVARLRTWADVGLAACVINALWLQYSDCAIERFECFIPYFPGARQDRARDGSAPLTLELMTRLLVTAPCSTTHVFDPHSAALSRTARHGANSIVEWQWDDLPYVPYRQGPDVAVIAPDAGAVERALKFRDKFYHDAPMVFGAKHRDSTSGKLWGYELAHYGLKPRHYVIIDDICDGGGTFNLLMDAAFKGFHRDSTYELVVSHGIFSKGLAVLHPRIEHITTTDSWCRLNQSRPDLKDMWIFVDPRLSIVPLRPLYDQIMTKED